MIKVIFIKELVANARSKRFIFGSAFIIGLFIFNAILFCSFYKEEMSYYDNLKNDRIWRLEKKEVNPFNVIFDTPNDKINYKDSIQFIEAVFGYQRLIKPISKMSFISLKAYGLIPNGIDINYFSITSPKVYISQESYSNKNSVIDWNLIFVLLLSFVVFVISYDTVSGEKSYGLLKIIFANGIKRNEFVIGKYLGILSVVLFPIIMGMILNIIIINILIGPIDFILLLIYLIILICYVSILVLMSMLVSSFSKIPIKSLSIILILWTIFAVVIPNIGWIFAKESFSVQSIEELEQVDIPLLEPTWKYEWELEPPSSEVNKYYQVINENTHFHNQLWEDYITRLFKQTKIAYDVSRISPFMVFQNIGEVISDNGFNGYLNFFEQVKLYKEKYTSYLKKIDQIDDNSYHLIWNNMHTTKHFMSTKVLSTDEIPQFSYQMPDANRILQAIKSDIIILIIWNILLLVSIFFNFSSYDVR